MFIFHSLVFRAQNWGPKSPTSDLPATRLSYSGGRTFRSYRGRIFSSRGMLAEQWAGRILYPASSIIETRSSPCIRPAFRRLATSPLAGSKFRPTGGGVRLTSALVKQYPGQRTCGVAGLEVFSLTPDPLSAPHIRMSSYRPTLSLILSHPLASDPGAGSGFWPGRRRADPSRPPRTLGTRAFKFLAKAGAQFWQTVRWITQPEKQV